MDWTRTTESKADYSEVGIAVAADGTMFAIYCLSNDWQDRDTGITSDTTTPQSGASAGAD
jgi:hypothetical protein